MGWSMLFNESRTNGLTLIEVLLATVIIGIIAVGASNLFLLSMRSSQEAERRVVAIALANERMEMIRNLPYENVGTIGGIPSGAIAQAETITRNSINYEVKTEVRYVDDVYDGSASGSTEEEDFIIICHIPPGHPENQTTIRVAASALDAHLAHGDYTGACGSGGGDGTDEGDDYNGDYKLARVEVDWASQYETQPVLLMTYIAPKGIEGGSLSGTLDLQIASAEGVGIAEADVEIISDQTDPTIDITTETNAEGRVVMPGFPEMAEAYQVIVHKDGYTSEQTYAATDDFLPDAEHTNLTMLVQQVTSKLLFIDLVAQVELKTVDAEGVVIGNVPYHWQGEKTIGQNIDEEGNTTDVYKFDQDGTTDQAGIASLEDLEWDTYSMSIPAESGYIVKEYWPVHPFQIDPGTDTDVEVVLVPYTDYSVQVTVLDLTGVPVDNATVRLEKDGFSEENGTGVRGQVIFTDLPELGNYDLFVDVGNYETYSQTVQVSGNETVQVSLTPVV